MAVKKRNSRSRKKRQSIWVMDHFLYPEPVRISEVPQKAMLILVWDRTRDFVLAAQLVPEEKVQESYVEVLEEALNEPLISPPMLPKLLRVPTQAIAKQLRAHFQDFMIEVQKVEEFDKFREEFLEIMKGDAKEVFEIRKTRESYLELELSDAKKFVRKFFHLMKKFYEKKIWKLFLGRDLLKVSIPELELTDLPLLVMGNVEGEYGISLFRNEESLDAFGDFAAMEKVRDFGFLAALFDSASKLHPAMRKEVSDYKWPVASQEAYPIVQMSADASWFSFESYRLLVSLLYAIFGYIDDVELETSTGEMITDVYKYKLAGGYEVKIAFWLEIVDAKELSGNVKKTGKDIIEKFLEPVHFLLCPTCFEKTCDPSNPTDILQISNALDGFLFRLRKDSDHAEWKRKFPKLKNKPEDGVLLARNWFLNTCKIDGILVEEVFRSIVKQSSFDYPDFLYEWFSAQRNAWISLWKPHKILPEKGGYYAMDMISGQTRFISLSEKQEPPPKDCLMLARLLEFRGIVLFTSHHEIIFMDDYDSTIREALEFLRVKNKRPALSRLRSESFGKKLIELWDQHL